MQYYKIFTYKRLISFEQMGIGEVHFKVQGTLLGLLKILFNTICSCASMIKITTSE